MDKNADNSGKPNWKNRSLFIADNYNLMRRMASESVDLICTDPPFAKNDTFVGEIKPPLSDAEIASERDLLATWGLNDVGQAQKADIVWPTGREAAGFKDIWSWQEDVDEEWMNDLEDNYPGVHQTIEAAREAHSESQAAYLAYMAVRLKECWRLLKPSGSLYLHCDPTASHYLKACLDAIFGAENFRNQIVWRIGWVSGYKTQKRGWIRNHDILLYYVKTAQATARFNKEYLPYPEGYVRRDGKKPTGKGFPIEDTWNCSQGDVLNSILIKSFDKEKTGYPTQKPVKLYERIIRASSNAGDIIFDPFAGCATTFAASERTGRRWTGCDINVRAWTMLQRQFQKFSQPTLDGRFEALDASIVTLFGPNQLPARSSDDVSDAPPIAPRPPRKYRRRASIFAKEEMLEWLLEQSGWRAWCCGFANWKTNNEGVAEIVQTTRNFHLDHLEPQSKGGADEIHNRAPLCPFHNIRMRDTRIFLADLRAEVEAAGELLVSSIDDLVDLNEVKDKAVRHFSIEFPKRRLFVDDEEIG